MSKETPILAARAKDMYVKKPLTFKEIAARLGVNERTVRNWKDKDGDWERERQAYIDSRTSFHEDLYDFCHELMGFIRDEFHEHHKLDPSVMQSFNKMLQYVLKPQDYEAVQLKRIESQQESNQDLALSIVSAMGSVMGLTDDNDEDEEDGGDG